MLAGIAQALRPDRVYLCVDTAASSKLAENMHHPLGTFLYTVRSSLHDRVPRRWGNGPRRHVGEQTARKMLNDAGFGSIEAKHVNGDIVNSYIIASKSTPAAGHA